jgi:hypothetical protein
VLIPVVLLLLATLAAAVMAYGTHPAWAQYEHGFQFILLSRKFQWPLVVLSLILCLVLLAMIISGKRRAWWLIGLAPILALFVHRFGTDRFGTFRIIEDPTFIAAANAKSLADDDWVVALHYADQDYAYPYAALFETPVVLHGNRDKRIALMWSAYANRAVAMEISRDVRATDLEVVSTPANALLVYNSRVGEFINGITGLKPDGIRPNGFHDRVPLVKTTWKQWRMLHPETVVLDVPETESTQLPRGAIRPAFPFPQRVLSEPEDVRVTLIEAQPPIAFRAEQLKAKLINTGNSFGPLLVFRDPSDASVKAFQRRVDDLRPKFRANADNKRKNVAFIDADTGAGWNSSGVAVDGPKEFRGKRLAPVPTDDQVDWRSLKCWYTDLQIVPAE